MKLLIGLLAATALAGCTPEYREANLSPAEIAKAQCDLEVENLHKEWPIALIYYDKCMQGKGFLPVRK